MEANWTMGIQQDVADTGSKKWPMSLNRNNSDDETHDFATESETTFSGIASHRCRLRSRVGVGARGFVVVVVYEEIAPNRL